MTADEIQDAARARLAEVEGQIAALVAERLRLQQMLRAEQAPQVDWRRTFPHVPLPGETWPPAQPLRVEPYVPVRVDPNSAPFMPGVYGSGSAAVGASFTVTRCELPALEWTAAHADEMSKYTSS